MIHACTIENDCLIGMGATVLDGAQVPPPPRQGRHCRCRCRRCRVRHLHIGAIVTRGHILTPLTLIRQWEVCYRQR